MRAPNRPPGNHQDNLVGKIILGIVGAYLVLQVGGHILSSSRPQSTYFNEAASEAQDGLDRAANAAREANYLACENEKQYGRDFGCDETKLNPAKEKDTLPAIK